MNAFSTSDQLRTSWPTQDKMTRKCMGDVPIRYVRRWLCFTSIVLVVLALLGQYSSVLAADWNSFPLSNGEMTSMTLDPSNALTVYVGTRHAGVFKTTDGGQHWQPARAGLSFNPIRSLAIDPQHSNTLYAGTEYHGIWKSTDGGSTWGQASSGLDTSMIVFNIVIDPQNSNRVYAGLVGSSLTIGNVYRSDDGGANWQMKDAGIPRQEEDYTSEIFSLAIDLANPSFVYAATQSSDGVFRSSDGGETWTAINDGLSGGGGALAFDPHNSNRLSAIAIGSNGATDSGYYVFDGTHWAKISQSSLNLGRSGSHLYFHPTNSQVIYFVEGDGGGELMMSTDAGLTWQAVSVSEPGQPNSGPIIDIVFHSLAPSTIYAASAIAGTTTKLGGVYKSTNGGTSWAFSSNGITAETIRSVAVDPQDPSTIHAGTGKGGVWGSHDGGESWIRSSHSDNATNYSFGNEVTQIVTDPVDSQTVYAIGSGQGIYKSVDHGMTYSKLDGVQNPVAIAIGASASNPVYAIESAYPEDKFYRSADSGQTWIPMNGPLPTCYGVICALLKLAIDPNDASVVWLGTQGRGVIKTSDGGDHWEDKGLHEDYVGAIAVSPGDSDTVFARAGKFTEAGSIYKTIDGGQTWVPKAISIGSVTHFAFDPRNPDWIYAPVVGQYILCSKDGGETWHEYGQGIFYPYIYSLAITAGDPPLLIAGSYGSGVYWRSLAVVADFTASPRSGQAPLEVKFTDVSTGAASSYLWDFGDNATSTEQNPTHTYNTPGTYTVTLTTSGAQVADTETKTDYITVTPPAPVAAFGAAPTSGVVPLTVNFTNASTGAITSRSWSFGDGATSSEQSPSHTYNSPGSYSVGLTVTGPGGTNAETKTDYITVTAVAPVASFSAVPTSGAAPLLVNFTDASAGAITSRSWSFGDGVTSTDPSPSHTYNIPGVYSVALTVAGPGGVDSQTKTNHIVVSKPLPTVTIKATDRNAAEPGRDTGTFQVSRTGDTSAPLKVFYLLTGSAKNGIDYKKLPGKVTIRTGQSLAKITVKPVDGTTKEKLEKVKVKLVGKPAYLVGSPRSAVVIIKDND
jgi:PKD repeat protein/photosystem II stability/assembly factor-like uncharacterized protein